MNKELIQVIEELLKENKENTKSTSYTNGANNILVELINRMGLNEHFTDKDDLFN